MIQYAVAAFIGAFSALLVMAEVVIQNRILKYFVALLAGALVTVVLSWALTWMIRTLAHAA
jgi:fatty-acid desaturase